MKKEANIEAINNCGDTPLSLAMMRGCRGAVNLLIEKKANINIIAKNTTSPLIYAIKAGHSEAVKCLIMNGAKFSKYKYFPKKLNNIYNIAIDFEAVCNMQPLSTKGNYESTKES